MITPTIKLFVFAFVALSISAVLSKDLEEKRSKITGAASLLLNSSATSKELRDAFVDVIEPFSFGPVKAKDFREALNLIVLHKELNDSRAFHSAAAEVNVKLIKNNLVKDFVSLSVQPEDIKKELEKTVGELITLMKGEFVFVLKFRSSGPERPLTLPDRVAELKEGLKKSLSDLLGEQKIDESRYNELVEQLDEAIPDENPDVKAMIDAYEDNIDLLTNPEEVLKTIEQVKLAQLEAEIAERKSAGVNSEDLKIFETVLDLVSSVHRKGSDLEFVGKLLEDLTAIAKDKSTIFGPETKPEAVKRIQNLLVSHVRSVTQEASKKDEEFLGEVMYKIGNYFSEVVPRFYGRYYKFLQRDDIFAVFYENSIFERDGESPEAIKFRKYVNIIAALYKSGKMHRKDMEDFIAHLEEYIDVSEAELHALGLLANYFTKESSVQYLENKDLFRLALVEFVEFISINDAETLDEGNVFHRFSDHLTNKANQTNDSQAKARYAILQIGNYLQDPIDFDLILPALDESEASFFVQNTPHSVFEKAHFTLRFLVLRAASEVVETLKKNPENKVNDRVLSEWQKFAERVKADRIKCWDEETLDDEESEKLLRQVTKMLTFGFTLGIGYSENTEDWRLI